MTTSTILTQSENSGFGTLTTYSFNVYATNTNLVINAYTAVVDEYEDVEAVVYFTSEGCVGKDKKFKDVDNAHLFAMKELMKIKKSIN